MATKEKAEGERLKQHDEDVKRALEQTGGKALKEEEAERDEVKRPPRTRARHTLWIGTYILMLFALGALHYAVRLDVFDFADAYRPPVLRAIVGGMAVVFVLAAAKFGDAFLLPPPTRSPPPSRATTSTACCASLPGSPSSSSWSRCSSPTGTRPPSRSACSRSSSGSPCRRRSRASHRKSVVSGK